MHRSRLAVVALALSVALSASSVALAQAGGNVNNAVGVWGQDSSTGLPCLVAPAGGSATCALPSSPAGTVASGTTDTGSPLKIGCVYNATPPTVTTGQRVDCQAGTRGGVSVQLTVNDSAGSIGTGGNLADGASNGQGRIRAETFNQVFNGTTWERMRGINDPGVAGVGVTAVAIAPQSSAAGAIVPVASSAVSTGIVVKASAGNLYSWRVTAGASAGFVMLFNSTTVPADGAVTPADCVPVPASGTVNGNMNMPERYSTGIALVFSTTGCFTKTASATAYLRATAQ